LNLDQNNFYL